MDNWVIFYVWIGILCCAWTGICLSEILCSINWSDFNEKILASYLFSVGVEVKMIHHDKCVHKTDVAMYYCIGFLCKRLNKCTRNHSEPMFLMIERNKVFIICKRKY